MFEDLGVFLRLGEATDVVTKEMFEFDDRGGRRLALRPEQTASLVRAFVENRPVLPWKAWYVGPNFRAENVQLDAELRKAGVVHTFDVYPGGHETALWQRHAPAWLALALRHLAPPQG